MVYKCWLSNFKPRSFLALKTVIPLTFYAHGGWLALLLVHAAVSESAANP
jgi:hypothetical protein